MNRIISFELTCKGSWTILYNLFVNNQHSTLPTLSPIQSSRSDFEYVDDDDNDDNDDNSR